VTGYGFPEIAAAIIETTHMDCNGMPNKRFMTTASEI
jgi:hypothetical protein